MALRNPSEGISPEGLLLPFKPTTNLLGEGLPAGPNKVPHPLQTFNTVRGRVLVGSEIVSWSLDVPAEELVYDGLADFIGGYGAIKQTSCAPTGALAGRGVAALRSSPARGDYLDWWISAADPQRLHADAQQAIAADLRTDETKRKLGKVPNGSDIDVDKKILEAHSMGGLAATGYAEREKTVDMMIKLMATGYGSPTLALLAKHFGPGLYGSVKHELTPAIKNGDLRLSMHNLMAIVHYYSRIRAIFEGVSCLREDVRDRDSDLRDQGIEIAYIAAKYDILVPPQPDVPRQVDQYHFMENAGHLAPQCKPGQVADIAVTMIREHQAA